MCEYHCQLPLECAWSLCDDHHESLPEHQYYGHYGNNIATPIVPGCNNNGISVGSAVLQRIGKLQPPVAHTGYVLSGLIRQMSVA